jgi:hypothetical protein
MTTPSQPEHQESQEEKTARIVLDIMQTQSTYNPDEWITEDYFTAARIAAHIHRYFDLKTTPPPQNPLPDKPNQSDELIEALKKIVYQKDNGTGELRLHLNSYLTVPQLYEAIAEFIQDNYTPKPPSVQGNDWVEQALDEYDKTIMAAVVLYAQEGDESKPKLYGMEVAARRGLMTAIQAQLDEAVDTGYLLHFSYVDWEIGDDDQLRIGDYVNCNHQRPHDGFEQNFEGQIVAHHTNRVPVILYNVDPNDPDNSGDYADLQSLMMDGWEFSRIKQLTTQSIPKEADSERKH